MTMAFKQIILHLEEHGPMTVPQLKAATGLTEEEVRGTIGSAKRRGYLQSFRRAPKELVLYAVTDKQYTGHRQSYRTAVAWLARDGMVWIFPSIDAFARVRKIKSAHANKSVNMGWKIYGEHVVKLGV